MSKLLVVASLFCAFAFVPSISHAQNGCTVNSGSPGCTNGGCNGWCFYGLVGCPWHCTGACGCGHSPGLALDEKGMDELYGPGSKIMMNSDGSLSIVDAHGLVVDTVKK